MGALKVIVQGPCHCIQLRTKITQGRHRVIEADLANALPALSFNGLPHVAVMAFKDRGRAAFNNSGLDLPNHRITINVASADWSRKAADSN